MWETISPIVVPLIGTIISIAGTLAIFYLRKWSKKLMDKFEATEAEREAVEALMQGVEKAQEDMVTFTKRAANDGKLTKEERQEALDLAIQHAKDVAKGPGLEILKSSSRERLGGWVKQILAKWKK